jgi:DNA ligase-1
VLDGELYHPDWSFQKINAHTKKLRPTSPQLQYWVYDLADESTAFNLRHFRLTEILTKENALIKLVECDSLSEEEDVKELHDIYVKDGYEGAIIRNLDGLYRFGYRVKDLQKYKEFEDKEFPIIGGAEGTGTDEGCVIFVCETEDGSPFGVRPRGSREKRQRWFQELDSIIGKKLTVRYQERSDDNIPIFPVGIAIRDYE